MTVPNLIELTPDDFAPGEVPFEEHCAVDGACVGMDRHGLPRLIGHFEDEYEDDHGRINVVAAWSSPFRIEGTDVLVCGECCDCIEHGEMTAEVQPDGTVRFNFTDRRDEAANN